MRPIESWCVSWCLSREAGVQKKDFLEMVVNQVEDWVYSTDDNYLDDVDFHDAVVKSIHQTDSEIIVEIESVNILPQHPLNPFKVAKNTGECRLIFTNPLASAAAIFAPDGTPEPMICTDFKQLEILQFDCVEQETGKLYKIFGVDDQFCEWKVQAEGFTLHWNEFLTNAWFVAPI